MTPRWRGRYIKGATRAGRPAVYSCTATAWRECVVPMPRRQRDPTLPPPPQPPHQGHGYGTRISSEFQNFDCKRTRLFVCNHWPCDDQMDFRNVLRALNNVWSWFENRWVRIFLQGQQTAYNDRNGKVVIKPIKE
jgi:hypothetical protein